MSLEKALTLMRLMENSGLLTLELEQEGLSIKLQRCSLGLRQTLVARAPADPRQLQERIPAGTPAAAESGRKAVSAAMSGIVHLCVEPNAAPLCKVGDIVAQGALLCLLESMKVLTRVEARETIRILDACVSSGVEVSQGDVLFIVEPVEVRNVQDGTHRQPG
jgi:acetyl-CoA carboxylase biotin carboxyl carrier protein